MFHVKHPGANGIQKQRFRKITAIPSGQIDARSVVRSRLVTGSIEVAPDEGADQPGSAGSAASRRRMAAIAGLVVSDCWQICGQLDEIPKSGGQ